MDSIYDFKIPVYRSIPDLLQTDPEELSFREKHRVRIFDQFEPITEADLNPAMIQPSIPLIDRSVQTTPLPEIPKTPKEAEGPQTREQTLTWQWPRLRSNDTYRVIKKVRDAQASNTYGFAYYNQLSTTELNRTPASIKQKSRSSKRAGARLIPLENASCGIAMEVAKADSKTNWEALMNHINESIRDTQQQRMIGQYMIEKLKKEQSLANVPPEQAAANKRCLEALIERYGTGLEGIVSKEKEFERLIEAYQIFMRGDKKKVQKKLDKRPTASTRKLKLEEPLPAIGDQRAGRSQVGCKIRQELRKEYGERVRQDFANKSTLKKVIPSQPGAAPKPMSVKVRRSVVSDQRGDPTTERACSEEVDLPPTPATTKDSDEYQDEEEEGGQTESQLSLTYVPSENQSVANLIPDEGEAVTVEIIKEEQEQDEEALQLDQEPGMPREPDEGVLMLEGDTDSNILVVDSTIELEPSGPAQSPKFELLQDSGEEEPAVAPLQEEPVVELPETVQEPAKEAERLAEEAAAAETEAEEVQALKLVATDLVNDIIERLDSEVSSEIDELDKEMVPRTKSIHFKSSPDICYYEKTSPEAELAGEADESVIIAESLSAADLELDDEAKALYHKVLSNPDQVKEKQQQDDEAIEAMARELTNDALKKTTAQSSENGTKTPEEPPAEQTAVDEAAVDEAAVDEAGAAEEVGKREQTPESIISDTARELTNTILNNVNSDTLNNDTAIES